MKKTVGSIVKELTRGDAGFGFAALSPGGAATVGGEAAADIQAPVFHHALLHL